MENKYTLSSFSMVEEDKLPDTVREYLWTLENNESNNLWRITTSGYSFVFDERSTPNREKITEKWILQVRQILQTGYLPCKTGTYRYPPTFQRPGSKIWKEPEKTIGAKPTIFLPMPIWALLITIRQA